ncbi:hypothetical protein F4806DRAFT_15282 [Annulohypoxylon nitens]|nr:hypothetical protein F4806DRAFT_15282 [Annulohypoxylon nitens]
MTEDKPKLHGVTTISFEAQELDFKSAIEFIKKQLNQDFLKNEWSDSLADAIGASSICEQFERYEDCKGSWSSLSDPFGYDDPKISICWFSVKLLNVLWDLLFGRTTGAAPWKDLLKGLAPYTANGSADHIMTMEKIREDILFKSLNDVEEALFKALGKYFPMKILMPKVITPQKSSLKTTSNSASQPPVKQPTQPLPQYLSLNQPAPPIRLQAPPPSSQPPLPQLPQMQMNYQQQSMAPDYWNQKHMWDARYGQQPMVQQYSGQQYSGQQYPGQQAAMPQATGQNLTVQYPTMQQPMTQQASGQQQIQQPPSSLAYPTNGQH